ncbi:MAG: hypothetical protein Q7U57_03110 [Methylovulum sp.]|nr:hypothetical protein [Methylovulum sp.]
MIHNIKLTEIAFEFTSDIKPGARYRRVQRFIHRHRNNVDSVAWFVMTLFGFITAFSTSVRIVGANTLAGTSSAPDSKTY